MTAAASIETREEKIESIGGTMIHVRSWRPETAPRGVVVICHGVLSHSGYYGWAAEQLVAAGYAVYALDLRGRGLSDGERFFIHAIDEYLGDVGATITLAKSREPRLPVFLLGHSAGGVISTVYALDHQHDLAGLVCESFAFQVYAPDLAVAALKGLEHIIPHARVLKLPIDGFSRDKDAVAAMKGDPLLANEAQPIGTVAELARAGDRLRKEFPHFTMPVMILHGTADIVTKPGGSQQFFDSAGSTDKTLKLYEGHFHDLLNDVDKELVMADITGWIVARTKDAVAH
ncbi:alpha/beta hydrolase [Gemmatimonas groenlandica]|uniref:Alpha/beta hydrolase n=1 Tax=Gemmatimonas groenlandica TaxID=2732249 RepID=A0A6M4IUQ0_9BACT|nr:alpha/beta hydrolase [Gemmatimonas groenlandica]QJR37489.1 alpha/beta hydrolase [Gemmatimonas groenlandica]